MYVGSSWMGWKLEMIFFIWLQRPDCTPDIFSNTRIYSILFSAFFPAQINGLAISIIKADTFIIINTLFEIGNIYIALQNIYSLIYTNKIKEGPHSWNTSFTFWI